MNSQIVRRSRLLLVPILALAILTQACTFNVGSELSHILDNRSLVLDALESSNLITHDQRVKYGDDLGDVAEGASVLGKDLTACKDNPCRLNAVDKFQIRFFDVIRRGHFTNAPDKLKRIRLAIEAVIAAARIYYSGKSSAAPQDAERDLRDKLSALKREINLR